MVKCCKLSIHLLNERDRTLAVKGLFESIQQTSSYSDFEFERFSREMEALQRTDRKDWNFRVREIGSKLFDSLFIQDPIAGSTLEFAKGQTCNDCSRVFISFRVKREYLGVPVELTYKANESTFLSLVHPFSKHLVNAGHHVKTPLMINRKIKKPVRILAVSSDTHGTNVEVDLGGETEHFDYIPNISSVDSNQGELQSIRNLANKINEQEESKLEVDAYHTDDITLAKFVNLLDNDDYHILHYDGHGWFDPTYPDRSSIFFWERGGCRGRILGLKASELGGIMKNCKKLRLAYFSCCQGATTGSGQKLLESNFLGLVDATICSGIPVALGMRWPISVRGAILLANEFYKNFFGGASCQIALMKARNEALNRLAGDDAWASPILIVQD